MELPATEREAAGEDRPAQTFVFADLAGYTALTEAHGDDHAADIAAAFCAEVRPLLGEYDAEEVKSIGDALMLRVGDAAQALHLAARIAGDFGARHRSLDARVGMHTGSAVERGGDWFGAAVNLAARVSEAAGPGEVLLTAATAQAAGPGAREFQLRPRGAHRFRNVTEPVELFVLARQEHLPGRRLPVDPVCRMHVDPAHASESAVHVGVEYHFCSPQCADAFTADPERYAGRSSRRRDLLVSDRARERTAERLGRAYRRGRITAEELEERVGHVWGARTRADLQALTRDLPRRRRRLFPFLLLRWARRLVRRLRR